MDQTLIPYTHLPNFCTGFSVLFSPDLPGRMLAQIDEFEDAFLAQHFDDILYIGMLGNQMGIKLWATSAMRLEFSEILLNSVIFSWIHAKYSWQFLGVFFWIY